MTAIEQMVRQINGATFANVDYTVPVSALRKAAVDGSGAVNPLWSRKDDIRKIVTNMAINLGPCYQNAVQGRLDKDNVETEFVAQGMKGKQAHDAPHPCLCQNMDRSKTYIRYMPMPTSNKTVQYVLDGQDVGDQLVGFLAVPKAAKTQTDAGLTEDRTIPWNTLDINNITAIRLLGVEVK